MCTTELVCVIALLCWGVVSHPHSSSLCSPLSSVQHERMKFLVIGTKSGVEVYAWAQKPYSKFMAFKVSYCVEGTVPGELCCLSSASPSQTCIRSPY